MIELTKFVEGLKGSELTATEYLELSNLVIPGYGILIAVVAGFIFGAAIVWFNSKGGKVE